MSRRLRAQEVDLCLASQPIPTDGLESIQLLDEQVWLATSLDHPLAGRASVTVDELADLPFVSARPGHWHWSADSYLSTAARLLQTTLTTWNWTNAPQQP